MDDEDSASVLSTPGREGSPEVAHIDVEKKKSKRRNPFKKLRNTLRKASKPGSSRPSSVSEVEHHGDTLRVLPGSPGSRRKLLGNDKTKARSLDLDGHNYEESNRPERALSYDLLKMDTLGSSMDSANGEISPGFISENQSDERRSKSEEPDSVDDRNGRGSTPAPQIMITEVAGGETEEDKSNIERRFPESGMKYKLIVHLLHGTGLAVRDRSGTSDPYVKFRIGHHRAKSSTIFKDLNPIWNEVFVLKVDDVDEKMKVKVYDYDLGLRDDFMGYQFVDISNLAIGELEDRTIHLEDQDNEEEDLGFLKVKLKLVPASFEFDMMKELENMKLDETMIAVRPRQRSASPTRAKSILRSKCPSIKKCGSYSLDSHGAMKRAKSQLWKSVLSIVLLNGKSLPAMDDNGFSDPYCKFKLGAEKFKSKVCSKTLNPQWKEQFDLHVFEDQSHVLEIEVWDRDYRSRDDFMGICSIDLDDLAPEETHRKTLQLSKCESGEITVLLTVSGTTSYCMEETDGKTASGDAKKDFAAGYSLWQSLGNIVDVGSLRVRVIKAAGVQAADFGGTSDPFVVLELDNARVRTETVYKTVEPEWDKAFTMKVKDIHSLLEVTVFDEDKHRNEFLGQVVVPLLSIQPGERRWFQLKDRKLHNRVKGEIQLEMDIVYNPVRASVRTFNPREAKYLSEEDKFKHQLLIKNVHRVVNLIRSIFSFWRWIQSLFEWESKARSLTAFIIFIVVTWHFDWWMPFAILIVIFLFQYVVASTSKNRHNIVITSGCVGSVGRQKSSSAIVDRHDTENSSDDESDVKSKEGRMSLIKKFQAIMGVCQTVQNALDTIASYGERVKNTFNWTVPFLSWLAVIVLTLAMLLFYFVPPRYLVLLWGINKFTKRLRKPNFIPNNELMDFLSRVPSDQELVQWCDAKPSSIAKKIKKR